MFYAVGDFICGCTHSQKTTFEQVKEIEKIIKDGTAPEPEDVYAEEVELEP